MRCPWTKFAGDSGLRRPNAIRRFTMERIVRSYLGSNSGWQGFVLAIGCGVSERHCGSESFVDGFFRSSWTQTVPDRADLQAGRCQRFGLSVDRCSWPMSASTGIEVIEILSGEKNAIRMNQIMDGTEYPLQFLSLPLVRISSPGFLC